MKQIFCRIWIKEGHQDLTKDEWVNFDINKLHRLDGPAYERENGKKYWYINGKLHRLDGPAIEWSDGSKYWFIDDKQLPKKEIETWIEENKIDLTTQEGQMALKLRWS